MEYGLCETGVADAMVVRWQSCRANPLSKVVGFRSRDGWFSFKSSLVNTLRGQFALIFLVSCRAVWRARGVSSIFSMHFNRSRSLQTGVDSQVASPIRWAEKRGLNLNRVLMNSGFAKDYISPSSVLVCPRFWSEKRMVVESCGWMTNMCSSGGRKLNLHSQNHHSSTSLIGLPPTQSTRTDSIDNHDSSFARNNINNSSHLFCKVITFYWWWSVIWLRSEWLRISIDSSVLLYSIEARCVAFVVNVMVTMQHI